MGVTANYSAPDTFDMPKMAQLIDAACAKSPQGLVISLPDATALGPSVTKCIQAGIPVISANSGSDAYAKLGLLTHVGQDESVAGKAAGVKPLAAAGGKNAICINQEVGNAGLDARCAGFAEGFAGGKSVVLGVDLKDPTAAQQKIGATLTADPTIDTVMALGPTGSTPAIAAIAAISWPSARSTWARSTCRPTSSRPQSRTARCCSPLTSSSTCRATCRSCS